MHVHCQCPGSSNRQWMNPWECVSFFQIDGEVEGRWEAQVVADMDIEGVIQDWRSLWIHPSPCLVYPKSLLSQPLSKASRACCFARHWTFYRQIVRGQFPAERPFLVLNWEQNLSYCWVWRLITVCKDIRARIGRSFFNCGTKSYRASKRIGFSWLV